MNLNGGLYNEKMITLARESRGLSQTELANQSGISQGKVSKVESGVLTLSENELIRIANCLQYPIHFFKRNLRIYGVGLGEYFHRKRQSVSQKQLSKIYARIEIQRMQIAVLLKSVDIGHTEFFLMDPDQVDGEVEEVARTVRATWKIPRGPIDNVVEMIENAGGIIIPFDFDGLKIDAISMWPSELPPLFFVNMNRPMDRIRFTLCHEVGHIIMHALPPNGECNIEEQADKFASELLMPSHEIGYMLKDLNIGSLSGLKLRWKVSMSSLIMSAKNTGNINPNRARYLWTQLSNAGYRTHEPDNLEPPREKPTMLQQVLQIYFEDLHYTMKDLSFAVGLQENEFKSIYFREQSHLRLVD